MDFVAIDFETATAKRESACAIAMIVVQDSIIVSEHCFLIRPPNNEYNYINTRIHGIRSIHTINEPTIVDNYPLIFSILDGKNVVAHNSSFDMSVLKASLGYYGLELPQPISVSCTYRMSGASLDVCCNDYGFDLIHHDPLSDARACAMIYMRLSANGVRMPEPKRCVSKKINLNRTIINSEAITNKETMFYGKAVVITGVFNMCERSEIADAVQVLGAIVKSTISRNTDILICGRGCGPAKLAKVLLLKEEGIKDIAIIDEDILHKILLLNSK